ncbi:hypothetical protein NQ317_000822 [Molorchus minor]|uniref:tRNA (uracil-O(2)-)-methyltransferase n=1 Tax=Molorchus minor TaxID=1323400 RepID=A0ABQ9JE56_9CUCU|nr:hypothetical protein NQ317_000822 [Molorchus minor]
MDFKKVPRKKTVFKMFNIPLATSSTSLTPPEFWESVLLYHCRPHLVNRNLIAVSQVLFYKITFNSFKTIAHVSELFTRSSILYEVRKLKELSKESLSEAFITNIIDSHNKNVVLTETQVDDFKNECDGIFISLRILMPRNQKCSKCIETKTKNSAIFLAVTDFEQIALAPPFPYRIELTGNYNLRIMLLSFEDADTAHAQWIGSKLFPKIIKWAENCEETKVNSLSLISVDEYCAIYVKLKNKYGPALLKEWPKRTNTNPQKYIFEDIAIASYLICLWTTYADDVVDFVDCGCGNGLLVYILNSEGYRGYGLDIRRRPIWDFYPETTRLQVGTVTSSSVFPDSTWIIGNHSDELTPWIPVIALKSSPNTNFFVLPCCAYDFSGQKYIRTNTAVSQYSDYFNYIENICKMCGFNIKVDKLRIPSTKRTCLVGIQKKLSMEQMTGIIEEVDKHVSKRLASVKFKPRPDIEKFFSCVDKLLADPNYIKKPNGENGIKVYVSHFRVWLQKLASDDLKQLKKNVEVCKLYLEITDIYLK